MLYALKIMTYHSGEQKRKEKFLYNDATASLRHQLLLRRLRREANRHRREIFVCVVGGRVGKNGG
jgi:hypothetical protein